MCCRFAGPAQFIHGAWHRRWVRTRNEGVAFLSQNETASPCVSRPNAVRSMTGHPCSAGPKRPSSVFTQAREWFVRKGGRQERKN